MGWVETRSVRVAIERSFGLLSEVADAEVGEAHPVRFKRRYVFQFKFNSRHEGYCRL